MLNALAGGEGHLGVHQGAQPPGSQGQAQDPLRREAGQDLAAPDNHAEDEPAPIQARVHTR